MLKSSISLESWDRLLRRLRASRNDVFVYATGLLRCSLPAGAQKLIPPCVPGWIFAICGLTRNAKQHLYASNYHYPYSSGGYSDLLRMSYSGQGEFPASAIEGIGSLLLQRDAQ